MTTNIVQVLVYKTQINVPIIRRLVILAYANRKFS